MQLITLKFTATEYKHLPFNTVYFRHKMHLPANNSLKKIIAKLFCVLSIPTNISRHY